MSPVKPDKRVRTTVRLPRSLYEKARQLVASKGIPAGNMNDLFEAAIVAYVRLLERKRVDAAFAAMADDREYQKEARLIAEEFSQSDWEALAAIEKEISRD
jgi:hypothetical protein